MTNPSPSLLLPDQPQSFSIIVIIEKGWGCQGIIEHGCGLSGNNREGLRFD
jgi:hypothetical protein